LDTQRPQCATRFIKSELRTELENVLGEARAKFGPVRWAQFANFMVALDLKFREAWDELPFYKKHPKYTGAALGITGTVLLAPVAIVGALAAVGFTSAGVAAGSLAATIQSIVYGGATGGLFSLLQSAGATMVLPSVGTIFAGAATTGAGIGVMREGESTASEILSDSIGHGLGPGGAGGDDDKADPPPYSQANPHEYLLTQRAIEAIIKSWDTSSYNPPGTDAAYWLGRLRESCEVYGVPLTQRALCAMHRMRTDCREAAHAAGCHEMAWDRFATWLLRYDDGVRMDANRKMAEILVKGPKV